MESEACEEVVTERVIPIEGVQLMFHYRKPFVVNRPDNTFLQQPRSIISGLSNRYSDVSTQGESGVVFVQFYPAGACHFFNFPLLHIENQSIDLADIFHTEIKQVEENLFAENSFKKKLAIIESFLLNRFSPIPKNDFGLICAGIQIIRQYKGQITSSVLSNRLSVTPKSLERKFSVHLGKTPKQFIKLIRYQEVLRNFSNYKGISLTEHAYLNGYFDQSHFIHDFKTFTGYTPKEFIETYPDYNLEAASC